MAAGQASSTIADLQEQVSALTRELAEAREQQTATSEVLPTNLRSVEQLPLMRGRRRKRAAIGLRLLSPILASA
jgi:hypothetical protein